MLIRKLLLSRKLHIEYFINHNPHYYTNHVVPLIDYFTYHNPSTFFAGLYKWCKSFERTWS